MYDPVEAKKSYATLFKQKGHKAAFQSVLLIAAAYVHSVYMFHQNLNTETLVVMYLVSAAYFTWKPKLIRFLRGKLRGEEWRDKKDPP